MNKIYNTYKNANNRRSLSKITLSNQQLENLPSEIRDKLIEQNEPEIKCDKNIFTYWEKNCFGECFERIETVNDVLHRGSKFRFRSKSNIRKIVKESSVEESEVNGSNLRNSSTDKLLDSLVLKNKHSSDSEGDFVNKSSLDMNRKYYNNTISKNLSSSNLTKPYSIAINSYTTIDNNKFDSGLTNMYSGNYKYQAVCKSFLSLLNNSSQTE